MNLYESNFNRSEIKCSLCYLFCRKVIQFTIKTPGYKQYKLSVVWTFLSTTVDVSTVFLFSHFIQAHRDRCMHTLSLSSHMSRVKHSLYNKVMHMCCKWVQMGSCREGRHLVWALVLALALVQEPEQRWSLLELQPAVQTGKEKICLHVDVNKGVDV